MASSLEAQAAQLLELAARWTASLRADSIKSDVGAAQEQPAVTSNTSDDMDDTASSVDDEEDPMQIIADARAVAASIDGWRWRLYRRLDLSPSAAQSTLTTTVEEDVAAADSAVATTRANKNNREPARRRTNRQQAALVDRLQSELLADDLTPPDASAYWTEATLQCWFEDGGRLTRRALTFDTVGVIDIDEAFRDLPVREMPTLDLRGGGGLLGALSRRDENVFAELAARFGRDGWAVTQLGLPPAFWQQARDEGERLWPRMRPGRVTRGSEAFVGRAPGGSRRGDRYIMAQDLPDGSNAWPALRCVDEVMTAVGSALAPDVAGEASTGIELIGVSHAMIARFPGDGARYGPHYDGDGLLTRMTMIAYTSAGWQPAEGGQLCALDDGMGVGAGGGSGTVGSGEHCWRSVPPREDTLLIFRSERVLHQVLPSFAKGGRLALTIFYSAANNERIRKDARDPDRYLD